MYSFLQYLLHFITANSRHGTHSPYVYALADQAIYRHLEVPPAAVNGQQKLRKSYGPVLLRMLHHWGKTDIFELQEEPQRGDVLFLRQGQLSTAVVQQHLTDRVIIVVDGIHTHRAARQAWQQAQCLPEVTVSIDLFHFGVLIHRQGQVKEDFTLRYPFWMKGMAKKTAWYDE